MAKFSYSSNMVQTSVEGNKHQYSVSGIDYAKTYDASDKAVKGSFGFVSGFFKIVLIMILVSVVFATLNGSNNNLTFTGFLNWLQGVHPIIKNASFSTHPIVDDWLLLNGLRNFLNVFIYVGDFLLFACKNLINLIGYITEFTGFLFTGF